MITKILLADQYDDADAFEYINAGLIACIDVKADHYLVTLGNLIEYKVAKNDAAITSLITSADSAYAAPP